MNIRCLLNIHRYMIVVDRLGFMCSRCGRLNLHPFAKLIRDAIDAEHGRRAHSQEDSSHDR